MLGGFDFEGIFFIKVAQLAQFLVTEECVVVKGHLGVERDEFAFAGQHARIDFEQRGIRIDESSVESLEERCRGVHNFAGQA